MDKLTDVLTDREREVVKLVAQAYTNNEIGQKLGINLKTVKNHVSAVFDKMKVNSRVQLSIIALHEGVISLNDAYQTAVTKWRMR